MRRLALLVCLVACTDGVTADNGTDALLQVRNAQFWRGAMPNENGGPVVTAATLQSQSTAGRANLVGAGDVGSAATGVAIALDGDVGYWTIRAKTPSSGAPTEPTWSMTYGLASTLPPGTYHYVLRAVDVDGRFGPATLRTLTVVPRAVPAGRLVISLTWDSQVDLDLHVLLPNGIEMFKRHMAEYEPPPISAGPQDPFALHDGGILDHDSNAHCIQDGQRAEDAVWANPPPPGHYQIRVDTFSMCGGTSASWRLEAVLDGKRIGSASGTATEADLRFAHDRGAGVLALEIDVP
jgi:hypothetical protein